MLGTGDVVWACEASMLLSLLSLLDGMRVMRNELVVWLHRVSA